MKAGIVIAFIVAVGAILAVAFGGGKDTPTASPQGDPVEITFEYSTEKQQWLESQVAAFEQANPDVKVTLVGKGSLEAENAIVDGIDKPTLWSPADSGIAHLCEADWKTSGSPFATKPEPLVLTPLVFVVWEDRAQVLLDASKGAITWTSIHDAVSSPKGWPGLGGKPGWGYVKLGQTDPTKSNSGLQALELMAYETFGANHPLTVEQLMEPRFQRLVAETEGGVPHFEASTGTFMTDMVRFGPSKYDIAVVYESLAISELEHAQGRWGSLHIYYPDVTVWSDHPIVTLASATPEQKAAAARLVSFLRDPRTQATALRFGFRPADPSVSFSTGGDNPFTRAQFGLALELPPAAPQPDGAVVHNLMMLWSRVARR